MKRFLLTAAVILSFVGQACASTLTVDAFITSDDVTVSHLEQFRTRVVSAINNADGANLQHGTVSDDALDTNCSPVTRWDEAFNDFVHSGLQPVVVASLTSTTTAGVAYIDGQRVAKDATAHTYGATKWTFVDLSATGVYTYQETVIGAAEPAVTANSIRLARVTTNATDVTAVRDDRVMSITLGGGAQEDFTIKGLNVNWVSTTAVSVDAGVVYNGSTRVVKTTYTNLDITSAADYLTGVSQRANVWLYIYVDDGGNIKLFSTAPTVHDVSSTTQGKLYYYVTGADYWRCIGRITLDATGSGNIVPFAQRGAEVYYTTPRAFICGGANVFLEASLLGVTSAIDDVVQVGATTTRAAEQYVYFRPHVYSPDSPSDLSQGGNVTYVSATMGMSVNGWFPVMAGTTYARAIDYKQKTADGYVTGYAYATRMNIRD